MAGDARHCRACNIHKWVQGRASISDCTLPVVYGGSVLSTRHPVGIDQAMGVKLPSRPTSSAIPGCLGDFTCSDSGRDQSVTDTDGGGRIYKHCYSSNISWTWCASKSVDNTSWKIWIPSGPGGEDARWFCMTARSSSGAPHHPPGLVPGDHGGARVPAAGSSVIHFDQALGTRGQICSS